MFYPATEEAASAIVRALSKLLATNGPRTPDPGGTATTQDAGETVAALVPSASN